LGVVEGPLLERTEQRAALERGAPRIAAVGRHLAAVGIDQRVDRPVDRILLHAAVPEQGEQPAADQHARDLGQRAVAVEPMERLTDRHGGDRAVLKRDRLGCPVERPRAGRQGLAHLRHGLDGDHPQPGFEQRPCQLAGARRQVEHHGPRRQLRDQMFAAAEGERFEEAAQIRDAIRTIQTLEGRQQKMATADLNNRDVFGMKLGPAGAAVQVFQVRGGRVVERVELGTEAAIAVQSEGEVLAAAIQQFYELRLAPSEVHLPAEPDERGIQFDGAGQGFHGGVELPELEAIELRFGPDFEGVDLHAHADHVDSFYVLEGEAEFTFGDDVFRAGRAAFGEVFGTQPLVVRAGGTLPVVAALADRGIPTVMAGLALPDSHTHSPNERMLVETFPLGVAAARETYRAIGGLASAP